MHREVLELSLNISKINFKVNYPFKLFFYITHFPIMNYDTALVSQCIAFGHNRTALK